jgi:uncharacterized protein YraI
MADSPRFHFFSLTFLIGFGVGAFIGVAFGLMAFAVVGGNDNDQPAEAQTQPTAVVTVNAAATATPVRARTNAAIDVRIGPGSEYAAVGTIGKGEPLDIFGRDNSSEWIAVRFPPGSTSRGWLPVKSIENLTEVTALAVVAPTPLPRSISTPVNSFVPNSSSGSGSSSNGSGSNIPGNDNPTGSVTGTPNIAIGTPTTPTARTTLTPQATSRPAGNPDLLVTGVSRLPDGRVRVVVSNKGAGDLVGHQVMVVVADPTTRSETLRASGIGLRAGEAVTLESDTFVVTQPTSVIATADPSYSFPDADRSNNTMTVSLAPPAVPTPTPNLGTIE